MKQQIQFLVFALLCFALNAQRTTAHAQGLVAPASGPTAMMKSLDQIEPRTPIAGAFAITARGSYYLTQNITVSGGNAITISASNVRLDLNGFTISSTASPAAGTAVLFSTLVTNAWICNGFIFGGVTNNGANSYGGSGFANGIYFSGSQPVNAHVSDISVAGCTGNGIYLNNNVGYSTGNSVSGCLVSDCGSYGIIAEEVADSCATSGTGSGIFAAHAYRSRGVSYSGGGILAALSAENCYGQCGTFYGLSTAQAMNCVGKSSTSTGVNTSSLADSCYGETATGAEALQTYTGNNCYGNHTGSGGSGIFVVGVLIGSAGTTAGASGYGIYGGNALLNGCIGVGATNAVFKYKYNMP